MLCVHDGQRKVITNALLNVVNNFIIETRKLKQNETGKQYKKDILKPMVKTKEDIKLGLIMYYLIVGSS